VQVKLPITASLQKPATWYIQLGHWSNRSISASCLIAFCTCLIANSNQIEGYVQLAVGHLLNVFCWQYDIYAQLQLYFNFDVFLNMILLLRAAAMARLVQPAPKFTHPEWVISNQMKYANAEAERAAAERLADEAERVIEETDKTTFKVQRDVNKKFGQFPYS